MPDGGDKHTGETSGAGRAPAPAKTPAPYGSWRTPITAELVASDSVNLYTLQVSGEDVFWVEMRPLEEGRYVIVRRASDGTIADVTPPGISARTLVHEYGGGQFPILFRRDRCRRCRRPAGKKKCPDASVAAADISIEPVQLEFFLRGCGRDGRRYPG